MVKKELPNLIVQPGKVVDEMLRAEEKFFHVLFFPSWSGGFWITVLSLSIGWCFLFQKTVVIDIGIIIIIVAVVDIIFMLNKPN